MFMNNYLQQVDLSNIFYDEPVTIRKKFVYFNMPALKFNYSISLDFVKPHISQL